MAHVNLYAQLRTAFAIASSTGSAADLNRPDILRNVIEMRLEHLSVKFWKKNAKKQDTSGSELGFEDMMAMLSNWIRILAQKGVPLKSKVVKIAATEVSQINGRNVSQGKKFGMTKSTIQSTASCNICGSAHKTEECEELLKLDVEGRIEKLYEKRLCYHCMAADHVARLCSNRPQCDQCGKNHASLLHDRINLPQTSKYAIRSRQESSVAVSSTETSTKSPAAANPKI